jgi:hypothetical protein
LTFCIVERIRQINHPHSGILLFDHHPNDSFERLATAFRGWRRLHVEIGRILSVGR